MSFQIARVFSHFLINSKHTKVWVFKEKKFNFGESGYYLATNWTRVIAIISHWPPKQAPWRAHKTSCFVWKILSSFLQILAKQQCKHNLNMLQIPTWYIYHANIRSAIYVSVWIIELLVKIYTFFWHMEMLTPKQ